MNKFAALVWMLVIVVAAFLLYRVKYEVQNLRTQIADTSHQLEMERESLHVVAAEWAYLNRPERLQALSAKYLSTSSLMVNQIAEVEAVPFPKKMEAAIDAEEGIKPASLLMHKDNVDLGEAE